MARPSRVEGTNPRARGMNPRAVREQARATTAAIRRVLRAVERGEVMATSDTAKGELRDLALACDRLERSIGVRPVDQGHAPEGSSAASSS